MSDRPSEKAEIVALEPEPAPQATEEPEQKAAPERTSFRIWTNGWKDKALVAAFRVHLGLLPDQTDQEFEVDHLKAELRSLTGV